MVGKVGTVQEYMEALERSKKEKPDQIRESLEIYVDLWKKVVNKGIVEPSDSMAEALAKIDRSGGLYHSAED